MAEIDSTMKLPASVEGEKLIKILTDIGVKIFNKVTVSVVESFVQPDRENIYVHRSFVRGKVTFFLCTAKGHDEFKIETEEFCRYSKRDAHLYEETHFQFYVDEFNGDYASHWEQIHADEVETIFGTTPLREKFLKLKEALLAELSK